MAMDSCSGRVKMEILKSDDSSVAAIHRGAGSGLAAKANKKERSCYFATVSLHDKAVEAKSMKLRTLAVRYLRLV